MFKAILIATDGSEAGDLALVYARELAVDQQARLPVVHIDERVPGHRGAHHVQALEPEIQTRIGEQVATLKADGLQVDFDVHRVTFSGPDHAIADAATAATADLIVLGSVGTADP